MATPERMELFELDMVIAAGRDLAASGRRLRRLDRKLEDAISGGGDASAEHLAARCEEIRCKRLLESFREVIVRWIESAAPRTYTGWRFRAGTRRRRRRRRPEL